MHSITVIPRFYHSNCNPTEGTCAPFESTVILKLYHDNCKHTCTYTSELRTIQYDGKFKLHQCNYKQIYVNHAPFELTVICTLYHGNCQYTKVNRTPLHVTLCLFIESDVHVTTWRVWPLTSAHNKYIPLKGCEYCKTFFRLYILKSALWFTCLRLHNSDTAKVRFELYYGDNPFHFNQLHKILYSHF
jgi:hypothetical protein